MMIKVCGIKHKYNLLEIVKLYPDFIGFNFYPVSPRYVSNDLTPDDLLVIPAGIKKAGIFVNQDEYEVSGIVMKYGLDYAQLHGNESAEMCKALKSNGIKIIKAFRLDVNFPFESLTDYMPWCDFFLFDTPTSKFGGSGRKFDWKILENYKHVHPFFLSGGIKPEDVGSILDLSVSSFAGIDINSGFETEPGIKDPKILMDFMHIIRKVT